MVCAVNLRHESVIDAHTMPEVLASLISLKIVTPRRR
jgi:hypothetical protein